MADIALFHSVLGVRPGITDAADRLRADGHDVLVVDQYDGRAFDDYGEAGRFVEEVGFPALMDRALRAVSGLDDGFLVAGFSNGAGMAEHVATQRHCGGALLIAGALPLAVLGAPAWPDRTPVQLHLAVDDPFRDQSWVDAFVTDVRTSGAALELVEHPVAGHLFTDASRRDEHDGGATAALWARALPFCRAVGT
jgi:dienelactone hydrolase